MVVRPFSGCISFNHYQDPKNNVEYLLFFFWGGGGLGKSIAANRYAKKGRECYPIDGGTEDRLPSQDLSVELCTYGLRWISFLLGLAGFKDLGFGV